MNYYEVIIAAPDVSRDAVINKLAEMGSTGFFEQGKDLLAYFTADADMDRISRELAAFRDVLESAGLDPSVSVSYSLLPGRDWNKTWKDGILPIDAGEHLTILPPWADKPSGRTGIIIDPGMAFGTGHHETTKTCLTLIERLSTGFRGKRFLDVGTGTGILAISAVLMGFAEAVGIDNDPLAREAAVTNAGLNRLDSVKVLEGLITDVAGAFDMIAANLTSGALIRIAPDIKDRLAAGGIVILSGMLAGQEHDVLSAMEHCGLALKEKLSDGKWVTLLLAG
ncbi:MAG: 50S ribosomal protein L11 methyltransferase [Nitrospiraceae bacterium]|nr:50S ribosomal protein L11 methyltransferase [Nitrospiraceae bacterium]